MSNLVSASDAVILHNYEDKEGKLKIDNHSSAVVNGCTWSQNGMVVATCADDGCLVLSNARTGRVTYTFRNERYPLLCVAFSKTDEFIATGSDGGQIQVWNIAKRKLEFEICENDTEGITCIEWRHNSKLLVAGTDKGILYVVDTENQVLRDSLQYDSQAIRCLSFSNFKHDIVATGGDNGIVVVWDISKFEIYHTFDKSTHSRSCTGIIFSPTNELLMCSCGLDSKIQFFDIEEKKNVKTIEAQEPLSALSFHSDGINIAAGSETGHIYIYFLRTSNVKNILKGHEGTPIRCLQFKHPEISKKLKPKKSAPPQHKIRSYEEVKSDHRRKTQMEKKSKNRADNSQNSSSRRFEPAGANNMKVESKKIPMKTNNRAEVKVTREMKNKSTNGGFKSPEEGEEEIFSSADIVMEEEDKEENEFQGPYVGPVFTSKQKKYLSKMLDEKLMAHEVGLSEYFSNFQVEMMRQFMIQKDELEALIQDSI